MLIRLNKHCTVRQNVIYVAYVILKLVRKRRLITYSEVRKTVDKEVDGGSFLILDALCVLYLLGLIKYYPDRDIFEFTKI